MNTRFQECLKFVLVQEGGLTDDSSDPGGRTNFGIEQTEYDTYRHDHNQLPQDVAKITQQEVSDIYTKSYWNVCHCNELPAPLDLAVFDCAVNQGNSRAMKFISQIFGFSLLYHWTAGMSVHAKTIKDAKGDCAAYIALRLKAYESLPSINPKLAKFEKGWHNRMLALKVACGLSK